MNIYLDYMSVEKSINGGHRVQSGHCTKSGQKARNRSEYSTWTH